MLRVFRHRDEARTHVGVAATGCAWTAALSTCLVSVVVAIILGEHFLGSVEFSVIGYVADKRRLIGRKVTLNMQSSPNQPETPKAPRKRTPVKKQASVWFEQQSKPSAMEPDTATLIKLQEAVNSLTKRLNSLETEWHQLLEHLSEQEDITEVITDEEEMN